MNQSHPTHTGWWRSNSSNAPTYNIQIPINIQSSPIKTDYRMYTVISTLIERPHNTQTPKLKRGRIIKKMVKINIYLSACKKTIGYPKVYCQILYAMCYALNAKYVTFSIYRIYIYASHMSILIQ